MQKEIDQLRNHYIVCGVGRVGRTVCARLVDASKSFVLIEKDPDHIEWARSHGYLAIQGSASEDEKLLQAGIDRARAIVCAVDSDSENIVITLSARELNPDILIVSRADAESAIRKIKRAGASHVVSPSLRGGEDIADALLRPNLSKFLDRSHQSESGYELGEVTIKAGSPLVGQTMHEYSAKEQSVVFVAVKRGDGITKVRPFAQQAFQPGDVVIVAGGPDAVSRMSQDARAAPVLS